MKIRDYRTDFIKTLTPLYDSGEAESFFYLILEDFHQLKRIDLAMNPEISFSETDIEKWDSVVIQLQKEIPIQYILGKTSFYGLDFIVNQNVLIPRPETEELVEWIISDAKPTNSGRLKIIDIGTGSGCIAISLAKNIPDASVNAIDISENALATARKNAEMNKADVDFILKDVLSATDLNDRFDVIVSNPPYVRNLEKHEIKKNVLAYEPHLALFVDDLDALIFYRKIAQLALKSLSQNGRLYFEINQYLGKEMVELLEKLHFNNIILRKDIYGNDRMISATI